MPGLLDALETLQDTISAIINADPTAGMAGGAWPGQTVPGWAVSTDLAAILAQGQHNHEIVIWPGEAKNTTRYSPYDDFLVTVATGTPTVAAAVVGSNVVATFAGVFTSSITVVFLINGKLVVVPATAPMTLAALATLCANAINAAAITGVTATPSGAGVSIAGAFFVKVNISGQGTVAYEVGRQLWGMLVTVYGADPFTRLTLGQAITNNLGTSMASTRSLSMSDGNKMFVLAASGSALCEKAQSSYSAYEWHIPFDVEIPIIEMTKTYQVAVVDLTTQIDKYPPVQSYIMG